MERNQPSLETGTHGALKLHGGDHGKSKLRAPPTCSTLQRSAHSTSPRCRQRCSHPDVGMQRFHSARGHTAGASALDKTSNRSERNGRCTARCLSSARSCRFTLCWWTAASPVGGRRPKYCSRNNVPCQGPPSTRHQSHTRQQWQRVCISLPRLTQPKMFVFKLDTR